MLDWKKILLNPDDEVRHALRIIDAGSVRTAFVVNDELELLGSITDGDIRRGLLHSIDMGDPVSSIMNSRPIYSSHSDNMENVLNKLREYDIHCMPILKNGCLVNIETLNSLSTPPQKKNAVFSWFFQSF